MGVLCGARIFNVALYGLTPLFPVYSAVSFFVCTTRDGHDTTTNASARWGDGEAEGGWKYTSEGPARPSITYVRTERGLGQETYFFEPTHRQ